MNGDTQTQKYLNIAANGTREDLPEDTCCTTKTQKYILDVAERLFTNEEEIAEKQDKLTAGENITISDENVISATGGSSVTLYDSLGENTDGAITQKASREMIYPTSDQSSMLIGTLTSSGSTSYGSLTIGIGSRGAQGSGAVAIGPQAGASVSGAIAIGKSADAQRAETVAVGEFSAASGARSTALGSNTLTHNNAVALGAYAHTTREGEVNVGTSSYNYGYDGTNTRVIGGVHAGVLDTDAVNVAQLNAAVGDIETALTTINSGTGV